YIRMVALIEGNKSRPSRMMPAAATSRWTTAWAAQLAGLAVILTGCSVRGRGDESPTIKEPQLPVHRCCLPNSPVHAEPPAPVNERDRAHPHGWVTDWSSSRAWVAWARV